MSEKTSAKTTAFSRSLDEVLQRSYGDNMAELRRATDIPGPVIYNLRTGKIDPSAARLEALADGVSKDDRRLLLLAAARDVIPEKYRGEVLDEGNFSLGDVALPDELEKVVHFLRSDALTNPDTAAFLRSIGKWSGVFGGEDEFEGEGAMSAPDDDGMGVMPAVMEVTEGAVDQASGCDAEVSAPDKSGRGEVTARGGNREVFPHSS